MIALLENLLTHPPFTLLSENEAAMIEKHAQIAYYPNGTILIGQAEVPQKLFIIIKGAVDVLDDSDEHIDIYHSHDTFGGMELLEALPSHYRYIVTEELICFEIEGENFLDLCENNKAFKNYFFSSIAQRIDMLKEKKEYASMSDLMVARLDESILHKTCVVKP